TLTHMLNRRGRIELETTVIRTGEDRYYLVCAAFFEQRLEDHLRTHQEGADVTITVLSDQWSALSLNGPLSREVLSACTSAPLHNAAFRWLSAQTITIAGHDVLALRMSYAGELGWELHMPNGACLEVYQALWAAGQPHGIVNYGSFAMNVMRMEKAFKGAGELTNEVTLAEADVLRFVNPEKAFLGKDASLNADTMTWVCAFLEIEPDGEKDGHGGEAVVQAGKTIGATASVVYGHTVGKVLAFAYIDPACAAPGTELEVVIAGELRPAVVRAQAPYDPDGLLPRQDAVLEPVG
ncbi:MAG: aminomethyltransferase family protein, partial [Pseudomonadota bacterium]